MTDINNEFTDFHDMFDRVFKKAISLSSKSLIRMINSLFNEDYPINSKVTFNWTEMVDDKMRKVLADTIVTVNDSDRFHFEAQMSDDKTIIFRMLEYGFLNAKNAWEHLPDSDYTNVVMDFPKQRIIYLYHENPVPEKINVTINFEEHQVITYSVKTVDFLNESIEDINSNNLIILIPFALLKLRKAFYSAQTIENTAALKSLFWNDIIGSIKKNKELGNITDTDASMLNNLSVILFEHIYSKFKESREVLSMRDQSIILEVEPYIDRMEEAEARVAEAEARVTEAEAEIAQLKDLVASLQSQLADKNKDIK